MKLKQILIKETDSIIYNNENVTQSSNLIQESLRDEKEQEEYNIPGPATLVVPQSNIISNVMNDDWSGSGNNIDILLQAIQLKQPFLTTESTHVENKIENNNKNEVYDNNNNKSPLYGLSDDATIDKDIRRLETFKTDHDFSLLIKAANTNSSLLMNDNYTKLDNNNEEIHKQQQQQQKNLK
jgi:hypothetical protein